MLQGPTRDGEAALGKHGGTVLTPALRIGMFPPLRAGYGRSYWGTHQAEPWVTLDDEVMEWGSSYHVV